jgi:predicted lipid-binding transport protein (Tim44 family)
MGAQIGRPSRNSDEEEWFMKIRIVSLLALASLLLAFAFISSAPAAPNKATTPAAAASTMPATTEATPAEPHPEIRDAIGALNRAKDHLEHAAHDFGGHRVEAIHAIDEAKHQLEICLKY